MRDIYFIDIFEKILGSLFEDILTFLLHRMGQIDNLPVKTADDTGNDDQYDYEDDGENTCGQNKLLIQPGQKDTGIPFHDKMPLDFGRITGHNIVPLLSQGVLIPESQSITVFPVQDILTALCAGNSIHFEQIDIFIP